MKKILLLLLAFASVSFADERTAAVLTGTYVASDSVNAEKAQQVTAQVIVSGTPESLLCSIVAQWSVDGVLWYTEKIDSPQTIAGSEQPLLRYDKRWDFSVSTTGLVYMETFNRWGAAKFFRVKVMESTGVGTTTALVAVRLTTARTSP